MVSLATNSVEEQPAGSNASSAVNTASDQESQIAAISPDNHDSLEQSTTKIDGTSEMPLFDRDSLDVYRPRQSLINNISIECDDIYLVPWWQTADVVYVASLLFSETMVTALIPLVQLMKANTWFISLKPLPLEEDDTKRIELYQESFYKMSWQMAKVYIYRIR